MERLQIKNVDQVGRELGVDSGRLAFCHALVNHTAEFPVVDPGLDAYLARMAVCWAHGSDATVVTTPLLPGALEEHYRPLGFTPRLMEVERASPELRFGDPLGCLAQGGAPVDGVHLPSRPVLLTSFVTHHVTQLGSALFQPYVSVAANSKLAMRDAAARYGFRIMPGTTVFTVGQCREAAVMYNFPVWLKADGSGSDFVIRIDRPEDMETAVRTMIARLLQGWHSLPQRFRSEALQATMRTWTARLKETGPLDRGYELPKAMVVEQDGRTIGRVLANICWQGLVTAKGSRYIGHSDQIISPDGAEWWGSKTSQVELSEATMASASGVCDWFREIGYRGCVGPDALIIELPDGSIQPFWIDPNGRPAMSTTAFVVHNALMNGEGGWINTNLTLPRPVESFADLREQVGEELLQPGGHNGVQAVLLASRSEAGAPSPVVKMLFMSRAGLPSCEGQIQRLVSERGIVRGS
ncbi:MAG: hypothetical protein COW24_02430 [Candidatus Kerfeldbacteria bacterium CG15_BIG_FIL_POST_REV_8_21_14_020_45_12]|uniref:ATP-grasp domain-containing protein n=1 Tax=Candidatus Kerfeldbacteria bacterium CG15_BIG_FIL_POST_REV_8_21_14_020_45_12 TaxID=2014247 RepID=A0A2M7H438_9BACT|nr:MAG: hypothetical protein COW24_02430 [Candidatus Kerfeldbacteria bacterium CG15_BIG_FIL_POST_REV_8_21_14_020_45_12]PJA92863.1 MAG: hypothetical protein CO132_05695 [Candidatus Kerfeldbacteria bacterium CG_4_9_14_3_um_filter_45_8]